VGQASVPARSGKKEFKDGFIKSNFKSRISRDGLFHFAHVTRLL